MFLTSEEGEKQNCIGCQVLQKYSVSTGYITNYAVRGIRQLQPNIKVFSRVFQLVNIACCKKFNYFKIKFKF